MLNNLASLGATFPVINAIVFLSLSVMINFIKKLAKAELVINGEFLSNGIVFLFDEIQLYYPDEKVTPSYAKSYGLPYTKNSGYLDEQYAYDFIPKEKIVGICLDDKFAEQTDGRPDVQTLSEASAKAVKAIEDIVAEVEVGRTYMGKVVRITDFGAFVEVLPGKDGLVHISQLALERVKKVEDVVKIGDEINLKELSQKLVDLGYKRSTMVSDVGEFSIRGDIADIYSLDENPVRIEFFDDEVESVRYFDLEKQTTIKKDDHALDELRYYIMSISNDKYEKINLTEIQKDKKKLITII